MTGRAPGSPRQTGQVWVFGGASAYVFEQPQNIFDAVLSWQWTSMPMTASYRVSAASMAGAGEVDGPVMASRREASAKFRTASALRRTGVRRAPAASRGGR